MAITFTKLGEDVWGKTRLVFARIGLDSSYPSGGYGATQGLSLARLGFKTGLLVGGDIMGVNGSASSLYTPVWDRANNKLLINVAESPAPIIVEETVTVSSNAGRLANVPAYILAMQQSTGGTTGAAKIVPTGSTLGTLQVAVDFTSGSLATFSTDAVTQLKVTYIPMGVGPFVPANLVIDETVVLGNGATVNLANRAALIQYVYNTSAGTAAAKSMQIIGSTNAPAANQIYPQLTNGSNTTLLDNAAQNGQSARVTYWKFTPFQAFGATTDASNNTTSNAILYTSVNGVPGILIPAYGVQHAAYATNTDTVETALGPSGTVAAGQPVYNPSLNKISFLAGDSITREQYGFVVLTPQMAQAPGQVATGSNLSGISIDMQFFGIYG